jgi:hypothetical protein
MGMPSDMIGNGIDPAQRELHQYLVTKGAFIMDLDVPAFMFHGERSGMSPRSPARLESLDKRRKIAQSRLFGGAIGKRSPLASYQNFHGIRARRKSL